MSDDILFGLERLRELPLATRRQIFAAWCEDPACFRDSLQAEPWTSCRGAGWQKAHTMARRLRLLGIQWTPGWALPIAMRRLAQPVTILYHRGDLTVGATNIGVVGSREATRLGLQWASDIASEAAKSGVHVVSGGARGIDAAAHRGALDGGGVTTAILGVAVDRTYPHENRELFKNILRSGGAIVSEHGPGTKTARWEHALRNRIVVGLSNALVVVEANGKSGTLGTVKYARRLGVPVFVPSEGTKIGGEGVRQLIKSGLASPIDRIGQVFRIVKSMNQG